MPERSQLAARPIIVARLREIATLSEIPEIRIQAIDCLEKLLADDAFGAVLEKAFADPHWMVREAAALCAYTGVSRRGIRASSLTPLVNDPNHWVRAAAIWAAGETFATELKALIESRAASDPVDVVRDWAAFALRRMDRRYDSNAPRRWYEEYMGDPLFAECEGVAPHDFFMSGLASSKTIVRSCSVEALSDFGYVPAFRRMRTLQNDPSPYVRAWLMRSIGDSQVFSCADVLAAGMGDPDPWVRFWALESAGALGVKLNVAAIRARIAREASPDLIRATAWALTGTRTKEALTVLEDSVASATVPLSPELSALIEYLRQKLMYSSPFSVAEFRLAAATRPEVGSVTTAPSFIIARKDEIDDLAQQFAQYQRVDGVVIGSHQIRRWLEQFETPDAMRYALRLLHGVDFYTRRRMVETLRVFLETEFSPADTEKTTVCLLGNPADSSSLVTYVFGDILPQFGLRASDLRSTISRPEAADSSIILFVDDNIGSGKQSAQIFHEWLDSGRTILKERHVQPLAPRELEALRAAELRIFVCVATREGCQLVREEISALGLRVTTVSAFSMVDRGIGCFHPTSALFTNHEDRVNAMQIMAEIGFALLSDKEWPESRKRECALGYGGEQKLLVFFYNVPTATLPVLWKVGLHRGRTWFPLFPRREKA